LGPVLALGENDIAARLVSDGHQAFVVSLEADGEPAKARPVVRVRAIDRSGQPATGNVVSDIGLTGTVVGLEALWAGGGLVVALSAPQAPVEVLLLDGEAASREDRRSLPLDGDGPARLVWLNPDLLVYRGGTVLGLDGEPFATVTTPSTSSQGQGSSDAGVSDGAPEQEAGAQEEHLLRLPPSAQQLVAAGRDLGWLRREDDGWWLDHRTAAGQVVSAHVAPALPSWASLLWAGDRYLVALPDAAGDIARYVVRRPRGRNGTRSLRLGGRMTLPRPPGALIDAAWDNVGARHVGVAQLLSPQHLRFLNIALGGMVHDAPIHLPRTHRVLAPQVVWDGGGYVLLWGEQGEQTSLYVTRFSCPDDE
jgi:hypothetical protein